jgi:hypothetical protein
MMDNDFEEQDNYQLQSSEIVHTQDFESRISVEDPGRFYCPKRFWKGFKYPFKALYLCFSKQYSILALLDTLVLNLIIAGSIALGIFLGISFINATVPFQVFFNFFHTPRLTSGNFFGASFLIIYFN